MHGDPFRAPPNPYLAGYALVIISFVQLVLGIVLLVAQIGLYMYCEWNAVCLAVPAFVAAVLFIITSIVGISTGIERTNGMIVTLLVMSIITVIITPVNMGLWGLDPAFGGIPLKFSLVPNQTLKVDDTLAAIYWGILFIPCIVWILYIIVASITSYALCCPGAGRFRDPFKPRPPMNPGYAPSPVYGGYGGPMMMAAPARPVRPQYPYY